jgi:hypothetical protein
MAKPRREYVHIACRLAGGPTVAQVIDARDGWPGLIQVQVGGLPRRFSLHVGQIHSMARKPYEYRFQNAGQNRPVTVLPGTELLLLALWLGDQPNVFVAVEPERRVGHLTRFSLLFNLSLIRSAQETGWAGPMFNKKGGMYWSFFPQLLPTFIESLDSKVTLESKDVLIAVGGAGLVDQPAEVTAAARARAAVTRLIRDARFANAVVNAYDSRCAMCGINMGLVSGAHIFPVSAPGSNDHPTNGLALCENHHRAFDNHKIWVHPDSRKLAIHPSMISSAARDERDGVFVNATTAVLAEPRDRINLPASQMFKERYSYFKGAYDWA